MPKLLKVATPDEAVAVAVPTKVPLVTDAVTTALEAVTVFPAESLIVITGCVLNAAPDAAPEAAVDTAIWLTAPAPTETVCVIVIVAGTVIVYVIVYEPDAPVIPKPEKVATPLTAALVAVP